MLGQSVKQFDLINFRYRIAFFFFAVKVGIGGFNMGVVMALYSATCFAMEKYENGNLYNVNVRAVIGFSGWLPGSRYD